MADLSDFISSLKKIYDTDAEEFVKEAFKNRKGFVLGKMKLRMYNYGRDVNYNLIGGGYYTPLTKEAKRGKGQITSHVTLRDTGDFYKSMTLELRNNIVIHDATDWKLEVLEEKYAYNRILGLTEEELNYFETEVESEIEKFLNSRGQISIF